MRIKIKNIDTLNYHIDRVDDAYDKGLISFDELVFFNTYLKGLFNKIINVEVFK